MDDMESEHMDSNHSSNICVTLGKHSNFSELIFYFSSKMGINIILLTEDIYFKMQFIQ